AYERGCRHFIVGLGGSATCDGGAGMLAVRGLKETLADASFEILCDVDNPFVGPSGAARVFGPQKGASPKDVEVLERRMIEQSARLKAATGVDVSTVPGAGAAGGLGGAFLACFGARLRSGIDTILSLLNFESVVADAHLVITGEGRSDRQTLAGKAAYGVLRRSGHVPVTLLSGRIDDRDALLAAGFSSAIEVSPRSLPLSQALDPTLAILNIEAAVSEII
ncbi:MAG: glycerate kinase, partial [Bacteroidales bacterium]|nr:glycerate kinase [Bacteroidales bacterium]